MKTYKLIEFQASYSYCYNCKLILETENTNEIKVVEPIKPYAMKTYFITCPECKQELELTDIIPRKCISVMYSKMLELDKRLSQIEYRAPDGSEFKKILEEARESEDFS